MSRLPTYGPAAVFDSTTGQSMAGNLTSKITIIPDMSGISYDISWSGTSPVGTIQVLVSNSYTTDFNGNPLNAGNWTVLPFLVSGTIVTSVAVSGNTGNGFLDIGEIRSYAIKLVYNYTSGSGTISATVMGKFI
jgi:hypothetical protein